MQFLMWNFRFFVSELLVWYGQLKQSKLGQPFPSEKFVHLGQIVFIKLLVVLALNHYPHLMWQDVAGINKCFSDQMLVAPV